MPISGEGGWRSWMLPYRIEKQEKTHRALRKEKPPSSLMLPLSWLGGRLAVTHSSLFIKGILSKRDAGGFVTHPVHMPGLTLHRAKAYALTWLHLLSCPVFYIRRLVWSPRSPSKAISKSLASVWETNVIQGQWLLHEATISSSCYVSSLSSMLSSVVVRVIGTLGVLLSGKHYTLLNHVFIPD